jgi:RimJ/RimL family protein N-acetyltransferase
MEAKPECIWHRPETTRAPTLLEVFLTTTLQLATPRLILRPWQDRDRAPFAAMNADPAVMTFFAAPITPEESNAAIDRYLLQLDRDGFTMLAAEHRETGDFAGVIGMQTMRDLVPNLPQPVVEIGWRLPLAYHGQGLATEGARAIIDHAFTELHLAEVVAITAEGNAASRRVMEKLGMTHRPELAFDHPRVPAGHPHQRHALYALANPSAPSRSHAA